MLLKKFFHSALAVGAVAAAGSAFAQDNSKALIDALVRKGILTNEEASKIVAEVAKSGAGEDVIADPTDKYLKHLTITGRFQVQFMDAGTSIDGFNVAPPSTLPAHPVASQHFLLRRIYLGDQGGLCERIFGHVNYDFANDSL